jgi:ribosomal protein L12E/L44/L45/RPP1/RPP2
LSKVLKASGNDVEAYWPALFAKALKGQDVEALLTNLSSAPVGGAATAAPVAAAAGAPAAKKEEGKSAARF